MESVIKCLFVVVVFHKVNKTREPIENLHPGSVQGLTSEDFSISGKSRQMNDCLFVWVEALRQSQQFFSHVGTFSWIEPVLLKMMCLAQGHNIAPLVRFELATLRSRV